MEGDGRKAAKLLKRLTSYADLIPDADSDEMLYGPLLLLSGSVFVCLFVCFFLSFDE